ncbi:Plasmodium exported protein (Pm-fam-a like), unknown function, partial [Plasmodium malariae]
SNYYKTSEGNYKYNRKLDKNYRLLAISKKDKCSVSVRLKEEVPDYAVNENKDVYYNEKEPKRKMKHLNRKSFMNAGGNKQNMRNKKCIFEIKKYSQLEKKIFKELDYVDFLKNNKTISDKTYKKIICKKFALRLVLPLMLLLFLIVSLILDKSIGFGLIKGLKEILNLCEIKYWYSSLHNILKDSPLNWLFQSGDKIKFNLFDKAKNSVTAMNDYTYVYQFFNFLLYVIPLIILGVTVIFGVIYYHKKVKKYEEIKFRKR